MSEHCRRELSHIGAVKCRTRLDPLHSVGANGQNYFDPTNDIYTRAFYLVCDADLVGHRNIRSIGNFCEAWLGLGYLRERRTDLASRQMCRLAEWLDEVVLLVYVLVWREKLLWDMGQKDWALLVRAMLRGDRRVEVFV